MCVCVRWRGGGGRGATVALISMKVQIEWKEKNLRHQTGEELSERREQRRRKRNNQQSTAGTINPRDTDCSATLVPTDGSIHTHEQDELLFPAINF